MPTDPPDARIRKDALQSHGIFGRDELLSSGLSAAGITRRVKRGDLIRLYPGVYRLAAYPETWRGLVLAAQHAAGPGSFSSHRTGGALYKLQGTSETQVEVSAYSGISLPPARVYRLRCTDVPPTRTIEGLRVACVERVLLDIAATVSADAAGTALDDALRRRITTLARMKSYLASAGGAGRDGTSALTRLLGARDDGNEKVRSDFETKMLTVMRSIRLPYEPNHQVTTEGHRYFLDFAFPGPKVGIECHSAGWHKSQSRWVKDIERSRRLARAGWLMLYFAWAEVISAPDRVRFEIEAALGSRGALLATRNSSWRPLSESS